MPVGQAGVPLRDTAHGSTGAVTEGAQSPPGGQDLAIDVHELRKCFGRLEVLSGISFQVAEGEVFGLLGRNGAGKTTTIRILTGRSRPSGGWARVAGADVVAEREHLFPRINGIFEEPSLYERLSARENLELFADLYGVGRDRVQVVLELVDLTDAARRRAATLSTGMRQRLAIARSLINHPRVLFLDEPTRGLDPIAARQMRQLIGRLAAQERTTVLLTTHDMTEAAALCGRVAFLVGGRLVAVDAPRELQVGCGARRVRVLLRTGEEQQLALGDAVDAVQLASWMVAGRVRAIHSTEASLEDVFVNLVGPAAQEG